MEKLEELKNEAVRIRSLVVAGQRLRWPKPFKVRVLKAVDEFGDAKAAAKNIGISFQTINKWKSKTPKPIFQEVEIIENENSLVLSWQGGLEVHGLSFAQFTKLLREGLL